MFIFNVIAKKMYIPIWTETYVWLANGYDHFDKEHHDVIGVILFHYDNNKY